MNKNIQVNAAIIIIGNEILSGRTQDVNSSTIALWLNSLGVKVQEVRVIPDVEGIIVKTINVVRKKNNYVFTTGGIGPTHDDITAKSISKAFNVKYEVNKEAYKILVNYYKQGEFNEGRQRMAKMPSGVELIYNPLTVAPGFKIENVFNDTLFLEEFNKTVDFKLDLLFLDCAFVFATIQIESKESLDLKVLNLIFYPPYFKSLTAYVYKNRRKLPG